MNTVTECPICGERVGFSNKPVAGERVSCTSCDTPFLIANVNPVVLEEVFDFMYQPPSGQNHSKNAHCPLCDGKIDITKKLKIHSSIICPDCDAELKVLALDPVELVWIYDDDVYEFEDYEYTDSSYEDYDD